jgi:drug/metabolite transporter (DMT)-like permease
MSLLSLKSAKLCDSQGLLKMKLTLAFAAIYFIWGSTFLAIRFAIETIPPLFMMGFRSFVAGGILYAYARLRSGERPYPIHWLTAFILGTLLFTIAHGTLAWSEQFVPSGMAALICATSPIWITLLQTLQYRDNSLTVRAILGLVMGFCGVVLLAEPSMLLKGTTVNLTGATVLLVGTFSWSIGAVYSKKANLPKNPMLAAGMNLMMGGSGLLFASYLSREAVVLTAVSLQSLVSLVYLIIFGSIITFTAYFWLMRTISPSQVASHSFVNPVVAIFVGWLVGGELLSPRMLLAALLRVIGVGAIVTQRAASSSPTKDKKHNELTSLINIFSGKMARQKEEIS